ncbi:MAG TPA: hypothetical protein VFQ82_02980 [Stellaceae bacterium]|nr:hypothetical protein [Stellaceae bacterium]
MVAVVEEISETGGAPYIELKVLRSTTDPNRVLGTWRFLGAAAIVIAESKPDSPVEIELRHIVDCADLHGIPFVWVNDPDELFPYYNRR